METVSLDLSDEELAIVAIAAHIKDMKLNDFIVEVLDKHVKELLDKYPELEIGE